MPQCATRQIRLINLFCKTHEGHSALPLLWTPELEVKTPHPRGGTGRGPFQNPPRPADFPRQIKIETDKTHAV